MKRMKTDKAAKGPLRRVITSRVFLMLLFLVVAVGAMMLSTAGVSGQVQADQAQFLADAVRRSAVQCYALEGRYPKDVNYLEEHYGLVIDKRHYGVYYTFVGDNILPYIQVNVIGSGR
jgi:hypothetical protein